VVDRLRVLSKGLFGLEPVVTAAEGCHEVTLQSVRLARWWAAAGFAKDMPGLDHTGKGWRPRVPSAILETNDRDWAHMTPIQGDWTISSIGLPPEVLRKVYFDNARRLLAPSLPLPVLKARRVAKDFEPGAPNFAVLQQWNKSEVYAKTIAAFAHQLARAP